MKFILLIFYCILLKKSINQPIIEKTKRKGRAANGYSAAGGLCIHGKISELFARGAKAVSFPAYGQLAHLQSGKGAAHAALTADDQGALHDAGRAQTVQLRGGNPRPAAQGDSGADQSAGGHAAHRRVLGAVAASSARAARGVSCAGARGALPHELLGQSGRDTQGLRGRLRHRSCRHESRRARLRISAGDIGRAGPRGAEYAAFPGISAAEGAAAGAAARAVSAARGQLGHQAGNAVLSAEHGAVARRAERHRRHG